MKDKLIQVAALLNSDKYLHSKNALRNCVAICEEASLYIANLEQQLSSRGTTWDTEDTKEKSGHAN